MVSTDRTFWKCGKAMPPYGSRQSHLHLGVTGVGLGRQGPREEGEHGLAHPGHAGDQLGLGGVGILWGQRWGGSDHVTREGHTQ